MKTSINQKISDTKKQLDFLINQRKMMTKKISIDSWPDLEKCKELFKGYCVEIDFGFGKAKTHFAWTEDNYLSMTDNYSIIFNKKSTGLLIDEVDIYNGIVSIIYEYKFPKENNEIKRICKSAKDYFGDVDDEAWDEISNKYGDLYDGVDVNKLPVIKRTKL